MEVGNGVFLPFLLTESVFFYVKRDSVHSINAQSGV